MKWYYESEGKPQGPVSDSLLRGLLQEGKISRHTLVWSKGMPDWKPLWEALPLEPDPTTGPLPLTLPPAPPADTAVGPERTATSGATSPSFSAPAWEKDDRTWETALFETVHAILTRPSDTFRNLPPSGSWSRPLAFYLLCSVVGSVALALAFQISPFKYTEELIRSWQPNSFSFNRMAPETAPIGLAPTLLGFGLFTILTAPIDAILTALLLHLLLAITLSARQDLGASLRAYCYVGGATKTFLILQLAATASASLMRDPMLTAAAHLISQLLVALLSMGFVSLAMARIHSISWGRALLALVLIPIALIFGLGLLLASSLAG